MRIGQSFYATPPTGAYAIFLDATTLGEARHPADPAGRQRRAVRRSRSAPSHAISHQVLIVLAGPNSTLVKRLNESDETAISNEGLTEGDGVELPRAPGRLIGWLQPSIPLDSPTPAYRLVQPDRMPIDTSVAAAPGSNTIAVGAARYTSELPAGATAGFQVLVLDPALRPQLGTPRAFATDGPAGAGRARPLAALLKSAAATTAATVVAQSTRQTEADGRRQRPGRAADRAARRRSEWMFLSLDGSAATR